MMRHLSKSCGASAALSLVVVIGACSPTVKLEAPDEPIRFDVNVNITEQKRLEIDRELLDLIKQNPALFGFTASDLETDPKGSDN